MLIIKKMQLHKNSPLRVGSLFSGIGAFEHALKQLNIEHEILFACDNGERELPLRQNDLLRLIQGMNDIQLSVFCGDYIDRVGVKKAYREVETDLLFKIAKKCTPANTPIVLEYQKEGRKSPIKHHLTLTKDQIIALTPNMTMKEREAYVDELYHMIGEHNYVKDSYFANYDITDNQWHEDVRFIDASEFKGKLDIMVGGSPCQSFSNYGNKMGLEDTRGTLFYDYARIIKECQPKIFVYENVSGLINHDKKRTWTLMKQVWESLGYVIRFQILDAKDYDHPQLRKRLFLIGFRKDIYTKEYVFPPQKELTKTSHQFMEPSPVDDKYYLPEKGFKWVTDPSRNDRKARVNQDITGCQTAVQQDNWSGDLRVERPQPYHYTDDRIYIGKYDFGNGLEDAVARKMTPRECLRLMGFSDDFKIVVPDKIAYRQSGNSIVVPVLKEIIETLLPYLD